MLTNYKYIHFTLVEEKPKTKVWGCYNSGNGACLGLVKWCGPWRQYCFYPTAQTIFSSSCLHDLDDFLGRVKELKRNDTDTNI